MNTHKLVLPGVMKIEEVVKVLNVLSAAGVHVQDQDSWGANTESEDGNWHITVWWD